MSVNEKAVVAAIDAYLDGPPREHYENMHRALLAALPHMQDGWQVKPLEWTESGLTAGSTVGVYQIGRWGSDHLWFWCLLPNLVDRSAFYDSADEAKKSAQADYEQRIRSALIPAAPLNPTGEP